MKRTPLSRSGPLKRLTRLRSKPKPKVSAREKQAMGDFHASAMRSRCVVCGRSKYEAWRAGTKLQAHHAVPKEKIKQVCSARGLNLVDHLWDWRNAVAICEEPCHRQHTTAVRRIKRSHLPRPVFEFAAELGLTYVIDRTYR